MNHTTSESKMQVSDKLRRLTGVVEALEAAGIRVVNAEATTTREDNVLVHVHEREEIRCLQSWLRTVGMTAALAENTYSPWFVWNYTAQWCGVTLHGFLTKDEAELWRELEAAG